MGDLSDYSILAKESEIRSKVLLQRIALAEIISRSLVDCFRLFF